MTKLPFETLRGNCFGIHGPRILAAAIPPDPPDEEPGEDELDEDVDVEFDPEEDEEDD